MCLEIPTLKEFYMMERSSNCMPVKEETKETNNFSLPVKIAAISLILLSIGGLFEGMARILYAQGDEILNSPLFSGISPNDLGLDPYEMQVPGKVGHWVLRPGYRASLADLRADKKRQGREIGLRGLPAGSRDGGAEGHIYIRINKDGFKGTDIDSSHARARILALGDSVTFGLGTVDYPKVMSRELLEKGGQAEVVNAGVEGYSARNVLWEMNRYKFLKPEIALVFIGWNDLFHRTPWPDALENKFRIIWLLKKAARAMKVIFGDAEGQARALYYRELKPVRNSADVSRLESYTPHVLESINQIIDEFESIGTDVVLVTLPGLFTMQANPSPKALKIGHLPYFTDNPFVLAKLTERYNGALKELAVRRGVGIIDLDKWSREALRPRETFFFDSVHLTAAGLEKVGAFMASRILSRVSSLQKSTSPSRNSNRR